jgi:hypothetical protein
MQMKEAKFPVKKTPHRTAREKRLKVSAKKTNRLSNETDAGRKYSTDGETTSHSKSNQPSSPRYHFSTEIPQLYNETYIRALPKNPDSLFVYWEIAQGALQEIEKSLGDDYVHSRHVLRLHQIPSSRGDSAPVVMDIDVGTLSGSSYIRVPEVGRKYFVEYGQATAAGTYFPICQSQKIEIPISSIQETADHGPSPESNQVSGTEEHNKTDPGIQGNKKQAQIVTGINNQKGNSETAIRKHTAT